jgi:hypothetical protein
MLAKLSPAASYLCSRQRGERSSRAEMRRYQRNSIVWFHGHPEWFFGSIGNASGKEIANERDETERCNITR